MAEDSVASAMASLSLAAPPAAAGAAPAAAEEGYYRQPSVHGARVAFVCEDDIWVVDTSLQPPQPPRRLTVDACCQFPVFSPDGSMIAYTSLLKGEQEVFVVGAQGGPARQLTHIGLSSQVVGWSTDSVRVIFNSRCKEAQPDYTELLSVPAARGHEHLLTALGVGHAHEIFFSPTGEGLLLGRNTYDPSMREWAQYRGGRHGEAWIRDKAADPFRKLILEGHEGANVSSPMWIGERIFFGADWDSVGHLYSCDLHGRDLKQHTTHTTYNARVPKTDGKSIVYQLGGAVVRLDVASGKEARVKFPWVGPQAQKRSHFAVAMDDFEDFVLHPDGHSGVMLSRNRVFAMPLFQGPAVECAFDRHTFVFAVDFLADCSLVFLARQHLPGKAPSSTKVYAQDPEPDATPRLCDLKSSPDGLDIAQPWSLHPNPERAKLFAITTSRLQLLIVDLGRRTLELVDTAKQMDQGIQDVAWSQCGSWLAYAKHNSRVTSTICIADMSRPFNPRPVTCGRFRDVQPCFSVDGQHLFFISARSFEPVPDEVMFGYSFPQAQRLFALMLRRDVKPPTVFEPRAPGQNSGSEDSGSSDSEGEADAGPIQIDFHNIQRRIVTIPVRTGKYEQLFSIDGNRILYTRRAVRAELTNDSDSEGNDDFDADLCRYEFRKKAETVLLSRVDEVRLSADLLTIAATCDDDETIRVFKAGEQAPGEDSDSDSVDLDVPGEASGVIDTERVALEVDPVAEWQYMFADSWWRRKEGFWDTKMNGVDWDRKRRDYEPLLSKVATRAELGDVIQEMSKQLGSSHIYLDDGDNYGYGDSNHEHTQGFLGVDAVWDARHEAYRVEHIVEGDPWAETAGPMAKVGSDLRVGDFIVAVNRRVLSASHSLERALADCAGKEVHVTIVHASDVRADKLASQWRVKPKHERGKKKKKSKVDSSARAVRSSTIQTRAVGAGVLKAARYRDWVNENQTYVHERSEGRVGYVHIPDMEQPGLAEFHRYFLVESQKEGLIVDVRWNLGGNVSELLVQRLTNRLLGWLVPRYGEPQRFPENSVNGPMVLLLDENTGSDGDVIANTFRQLNLGTLIGRRSWGGCLGMEGQDLVDGTEVSMPDNNYYALNVGFGIENHGVAPDIEVDIAPHHYQADEDPQLDTGVATVLAKLEGGEGGATLPEDARDHS